jgi:hypothetical protein
MHDFVKRMETHPDKDSEEVQYEVAKIRGYLAQPDPRVASGKKTAG